MPPGPPVKPVGDIKTSRGVGERNKQKKIKKKIITEDPAKQASRIGNCWHTTLSRAHLRQRIEVAPKMHVERHQRSRADHVVGAAAKGHETDRLAERRLNAQTGRIGSVGLVGLVSMLGRKTDVHATTTWDRRGNHTRN